MRFVKGELCIKMRDVSYIVVYGGKHLLELNIGDGRFL